ncbi:MAG: hypothetical protein ACLSDM_00445 [Butyricicoccus sp.]
MQLVPFWSIWASVVSDVDTALVTLKFANGAIGVIDNSRRRLRLRPAR